MLLARNLEYRIAGRRVLDVPTLTLGQGAATAVVGPNGSGKSTLLRVLAFLESPSGGELVLDGRVVSREADRRAARRQVTLVEQQPLLFDASVRANLRYPLALRRAGGPEGMRRVAESLEAVGASHLADRPARALSGGETQRVAIARALVLAPRVLLLDEPTSAGDRSATAQLGDLFDRLRADGVSICFTSHQLEEAYRWADHIVALADGRVANVTPENLFRAVLPAGAGPKAVRAGPLDLLVVTDRVGPATIALSPDDILVSPHPIRSSARNHFTGTIARIADDGRGGVALTVDVGAPLVVRITRAALDDLSLRLGATVTLTVKAMAVRVF